MKKQVFGRQFKRDINERKALFKGLATSLVMHERIETTEEKAKAIKGLVEKLVTKALKNNGSHAESLLSPYLASPAVKKLISDVAPRFANRKGGYTRIIKIGQRFNDNANMVIMEWVEKPVIKATALVEKKTKKDKNDEVALDASVGTKTPEKKATKKAAKKEVTKEKKTPAKKTKSKEEAK